jgi:hypothetical protein
MKNYLKFPIPSTATWFRLPEKVQDIVNSVGEVFNRVTNIENSVWEVSNRVTDIENISSSIATIDTSIYSTNPVTSNFDTRNGIYLGDSAGNGTNDQKNIMTYL